ncbi:GntR family transcriptional regulator [Aliiruegeria haliotis]|uniref:GntR family transcriptional regulator n=1 Tax=Aliiruegeria haliotis TaxID=1280846 RepID=A0A2T0RMV5_9RHOB|nr:GntR family transcriptional regulator [Aliiruegeria haliotis]PRY22488.1 GntR family transcriptional regulator [Aliiruegeria haliotis]
MSRDNVIYKEAYNRSLDRIAEFGAGECQPSEARIASLLGITRTTVRAVLEHLQEVGILQWEGRRKAILRLSAPQDYYPADETVSRSEQVETVFMEHVLGGDLAPGTILRESELARDFGLSLSAVREFLIRFSRIGLIEKEPNRHWVLRGFTRSFAMEVFEVRETWEKLAFDRFLAAGPDPEMQKALLAMRPELEAIRTDIDRRYLEFPGQDEAFHRLNFEYLNNRFVYDFFPVVLMIFHYHYRWNKSDEKERNLAAIEVHLAVIEALAEGDTAAARRAFHSHLDQARRTLLQSVRWGEEP